MSRFPRTVTLRVLLRSLLVQGSWNYETLIGTGFAFTILPVLRYLYPADAEALRAAIARHTDVFNSHPYLATVAAGAVARLEADRVDPRLIDRFKSALRGSLGALGDQLIWGAWRPASILLGITLLLAGVVWWASVLVFLLVYNALSVGLRIWGWRIGITSGLEVGKALRDAPLQPLARRIADAGAVLGGFAMVLAAAPALTDPTTAVVDAAALVTGAVLGVRTRSLFVAVITAAWFLALVWGWSR